MSLLNARLQTFLDQNRASYRLVHHRPDYSTQFTAQDTHTPGHKFLKPVIIGIGVPETKVMVVVAADTEIDFRKLADWFETPAVRLVSKEELADLFPDCEVGAEPPLGNLYGLAVYADPSLDDNDIVAFNGGNHDTAVRMRWSDYVKYVGPTSLKVARKLL